MEEEEMQEEGQAKFVDKTRVTIDECGKWLCEHAEELARKIVGGCKRWAIRFEAGDDGLFSDVCVDAVKIELDTEDPLLWAEIHERVLEERFEYGKPLVHEHGWERREGKDRW